MGPFRILVVDDHADTCAVLARLLAGDGHAVRTAQSVAEALAVTGPGADGGQAGCDVLVADIGLPDGLGTDLLAALRRQDGRDAGEPVTGIALTGYGDEQTRADCVRAGFAAVLVKPATYEALRAAIATATANRVAATPPMY